MFLQALRTFSRQNQDIRDIRGQSLASEVVTTSEFTDVVLAILGVAAKLERRRILDRTARGHEAAKAARRQKLRKPKLTDHQRKEAPARCELGLVTLTEIAKSYNVSHSMISRLTP